MKQFVTATVLALACATLIPAVDANAAGAAPGQAMRSSWTSRDGTRITGFRPQVNGAQCVAEYTASNPGWTPKGEHRTRASWTASREANGDVRCTGGTWTNLQVGRSGPQADMIIRGGRAYAAQ